MLPEHSANCDSHGEIASLHLLEGWDDDLHIEIACYEINIETGECWFCGADFTNEAKTTDLRIEAVAWANSLQITSEAVRQKLALERTEDGKPTGAALFALRYLWRGHQDWKSVWPDDMTDMPILSTRQLGTLAIGHPSEAVALAAINTLHFYYTSRHKMLFRGIVTRTRHEAVRQTILQWFAHKPGWMQRYTEAHS